MTTIKDITPNADSHHLQRQHPPGRNAQHLQRSVESDRSDMALMVAVCTAIESGCEFVTRNRHQRKHSGRERPTA